ncbi:MAG: hypothetical protein OXD31_09730 [Chloroflexi bacterium]|nr:hypothetical protein [Chloroflexota bacterium]
MKRTLLIAALAMIGLMACLPDVSTELSEPEARALIEREVLNVCKGKSTTIIANLLNSVQDAEPLATRDNWIFSLNVADTQDELETYVFPSKIVSGPFVVHLQTDTCK